MEVKRIETTNPVVANALADYPWDEKVARAFRERTRRDANTIRRTLQDMVEAQNSAYATYESMPRAFRDNYESLIGELHAAEVLEALCR